MCSTIDSLVTLITGDNQFQVLKLASGTTNNTFATTGQSINLVCFLNPIHASYIHVVEENHAEYLINLPEHELTKIVDQLYNLQTLFLIFSHGNQIPDLLLNQNKISIGLYTGIDPPTAFKYLFNAVYHIPIDTISIHGCMVVIFGQGLLITGSSGSGKSSLLLALLARNHLWVADDAPRIYINHLDHIVVAHPAHLSEYIHVKQVGAINADQTFGKSARISHHKLAAIIHLSDNTPKRQSTDTLLSCHSTQKILGVKIPEWHLQKQDSNIAIMTETIAKQLILNQWGDNASKMLSNAHDASVNCN